MNIRERRKVVHQFKRDVWCKFESESQLRLALGEAVYRGFKLRPNAKSVASGGKAEWMELHYENGEIGSGGLYGPSDLEISPEEFTQRLKGTFMKRIEDYKYVCKNKEEAEFLLQLVKSQGRRMLGFVYDGREFVTFAMSRSNEKWGLIGTDSDTDCVRKPVHSFDEFVKGLCGMEFQTKPEPREFEIGCQKFSWAAGGYFQSREFSICNGEILQIVSEGQRLGHLPKTIQYQEEK